MSITPAEVLKSLSKPDPEFPEDDKFKDLPPLSLRRFMCERFLSQELGNGNFPYNFGKHNGSYWERDRKPNGDWDKPDRRLEDLYLFSIVSASHLTNEQVEAITRAYIAQEKLPEPILFYTFPDYRACGECDAKFSLFTDGLKVWTPHDCPFPDGAPPYFHDFEFPSGKIVIENDLRHLFPDHGELGGNGAIWEKRITQYYAANNMAHFFVGNTCPGFWELPDGSYIIAPTPHDKDYNDIEVPWKSRGSICTDLWWYSIMDLAWFKVRGGKIQKHHQDIVEVPPGRYRFTHNYRATRDVGGVEEIYTKIERIGDVSDA